jgi:ribosomal protein L16
MLQPARRKYRKEQKGRNKGIATRGTKVSFGEFGLKAIGRGRITARQIEAARRAMTAISNAGAVSGSGFSRTSRFRRSRQRYGWATARAIPSTTLPRFSRAR